MAPVHPLEVAQLVIHGIVRELTLEKKHSMTGIRRPEPTRANQFGQQQRLPPRTRPRPTPTAAFLVGHLESDTFLAGKSGGTALAPWRRRIFCTPLALELSASRVARAMNSSEIAEFAAAASGNGNDVVGGVGVRGGAAPRTPRNELRSIGGQHGWPGTYGRSHAWLVMRCERRPRACRIGCRARLRVRTVCRWVASPRMPVPPGRSCHCLLCWVVVGVPALLYPG